MPPPRRPQRNPRPFNVRSLRGFQSWSQRWNGSGTLSAVTRDSGGNVLGGCTVLIFDQNWNLLGQTISDAVTGAWSFVAPNNQLYNVAGVKRGATNVAGMTIDESIAEAGTLPPASLATILGTDLQIWYSNRTTGSGATLTWIDEESHVNITALGTAPSVISVGTAGNTGMRYSGPEDLTNSVTFLPGPSAGNPVNRVISGFAFKVTGATSLGAEGDILSAVAQGPGTSCLKAAILPTTGKLEFTFRANNGSFAIFDSNASLVDSTWHTGIGVWNGTTGLAQMYVDGVLQTATDSTTASPQRFTDTDEQIVIGDGDSFRGDLVSPFLAWNASSADYTASQIASIHSYLIGLTV